MSASQISSIKLALKELQGKHAKWKAIGEALSVPSQDIAIIECNHREDGERCLEEVLQYWFRNHPESNVVTLTEILDASEEASWPTTRHLLGSGDMDTLMAVLGAAAPHWREVARGLGFSHQEVEMVLSDIRHQNQLDYLEETVSQWLRWEPKNGHPYPVAEDLVKTLRLEEVGEYGLAEEVEKHPVLMSQDRTKGAPQDIPLRPKKQKLASSDASQQRREDSPEHKGSRGNPVTVKED